MNRLVLIIFGSILLISILSGIYYGWRKGVEREALLEYNQRQLEQTIKDQEEFRRKMNEIQKVQEDIIKQNAEDRKEFAKKMNEALDDLNTEEAKKADRPASDILKQTIRKLQAAPK